MFEINWKYADYEIRTYKSSDANTLPFIELVKWFYEENQKPHCIVLASYEWDSEGGELHFVGNRPFEYIADLDIQVIWKQLWLACEMILDAWEKEKWGKK